MKKKWKVILGAVTVLVVLAFVVTQALQKTGVEVIEAVPRDIAKSFTEEGVVKAKEEHTVYSMYGGRVDALPVKEGDMIEEGELLISLEDEEISHTLAQLEAQLRGLEGEELKLTEKPGSAEVGRLELGIEQAEKGLDTAEKNYERIKQLYENEIVSKVEMEEAENRLKEARHIQDEQQKSLDMLYESYQAPRGSREIIEAQRSALLSQIDLYNYKKDNYRTYAPFSGIVGSIEIEKRELVNPQAPVMTIYSREGYIIEVRVLTRDVYDISPGMNIDLILEKSQQDIKFTGEVIAIAPYAEESISPLGLEEERVKITILPDVPEGLEIAPGYKLEVEFTTAEKTDKLVVPKSTLFSYEGEDALLVVENERVSIRTVTTGLETRRDVVITKGLQEGDLVILNPQEKDLAKGSRVSYSIINGGGDKK